MTKFKISDRYIWEVETGAGATFQAGMELPGGINEGLLDGCVRFSLIPQAPGLPRHDFTGLAFKLRFARAFNKVRFNNPVLPGNFFWENGSKIIKTSEDQTANLQPGDLIGKGVAGEAWYPIISVTPGMVVLGIPYRGNTKPRGMQAKKLNQAKMTEYVHCVECAECRLWVFSTDGRVLTTDKKYELYI